MSNNLRREIKSRISDIGARPRKSLGQNFLVSESAYQKIMRALELKGGEVVIEVGPGLGILTEYLADTGADVTAVEKDDKLADFLRDRFSARGGNVKIINEDILDFKFAHSAPLGGAAKAGKSNGYKLVGNIPYYLTSHLIRTLFESAGWRMAAPK